MARRGMVIGLMAAALAATLALAGCGGSQAASSASAAASEAASSAAAAAASAESATASEASAAAVEASSAASEAAVAASETASAAASAATAVAASAAQQYIGEEAAMAAALAHAGLAQGDVTELDAELDNDDPVIHYDVDFKSGGMEYDYEIDAATGDVITFSSEADD